MGETKPYLPKATFEQVLNYNPADAATHTASPIVNAVAEALHETKFIEACEFAAYLEVDQVKLSHAIILDLGMSLKDLIHNFRLEQAMRLVAENPDMPVEEIAQACGYASAGSLWRFIQRKTGMTVLGQKSQAGPENFNEMCKRLRNR